MAVAVAALLVVKESAQVERSVRTNNIADFDSTSFLATLWKSGGARVGPDTDPFGVGRTLGCGDPG